MWFIGVEVEQETSAPPPKKKSWIRPCNGLALFHGLVLHIGLTSLHLSPLGQICPRKKWVQDSVNKLIVPFSRTNVMKNSFSYSGAVLWNSLPWREKLNIWVNLNDWLIRISDFFFKYCVHGIHEKQVLNRLVVDSFAYCLGGLFNFFSIYTPDEFYRVLKKELFCSTKFSLSPSPPPHPTAVSDLKDRGLQPSKKLLALASY